MVSEIVTAIGNRHALVDACVSRDLERRLKQKGLQVRHVASMGTSLKDHEIMALMKPNEVLITRDHGFAKILGEARAILLMPKDDIIRRHPKLTKKDKRAAKKRISTERRYEFRQEIMEQTKSGVLWTKILLGILFVFGFPIP